MQLLLDTPAFLWWVEDSPRLSRRARRAIAEPGNACWLSLVSCWETAIKVSLGKLRLRSPLARFVPEQLGANGFRLLEVDLGDVSRIAGLPFHHRDRSTACSSRRPLVESCGSSRPIQPCAAMASSSCGDRVTTEPFFAVRLAP